MPSFTPELPSGQFFGRPRQHHEGRGFRITESAYRASERLPAHAHRRAHFCLVVAGRYTEQIEHGEALRTPGDLLFYPPGTDHAEAHHEPGRHLLVEIDDRLLERFCRSGDADDGVSSCGASARWTAGRLLREMRRSRRAVALAIEGLVLQLLAEAARSATTEAPPTWIERARRLLRRELDAPPSVRDLAAQLGISTRRLERDLRRWEGTTLPAWIRRLRIEVATERLISTEKPLVDIALELGYYDQSHFTRCFRSATGVTPGRYRRAFEGT